MGFSLVILGVILLGGALGFLAAVSFGSKHEDRAGRYRAWRDQSQTGPLGRAARSVMGVTISDTRTVPGPRRESGAPAGPVPEEAVPRR